MHEVWRRMVIGSAIAVYLAGLASVGGMLLKQMRGEPLAIAEAGR